jgi:hypothetical protein
MRLNLPLHNLQQRLKIYVQLIDYFFPTEIPGDRVRRNALISHFMRRRKKKVVSGNLGHAVPLEGFSELHHFY